ncbi:armadillo repeat-containing protein 1 [Daphnia magna]|nr:armadillo repeat-containing protein 1 [Daphnia magna]KZS09339.1 Armadillo repeat-containing protein 1 [Daphnia magna]
MEDISSTALVTVQAYRNIAEDASKRGTLIQDETSVQFLAYVLGEKNVEVVGLALETLKLLSDTQRHRQKLAAVFGVLEALQATADAAEEFGEEIANSAADIFTALKFSKNSTYGNRKPTGQPKVERIPSTEEAVEDEGLFGALDTSSHSDRGHRFLKYNSKAKTITVKVTGLTTNQEDRELLERQLIKVQGVISIVFDANNSRVTLRSRPDLNIESVGQAVRKTQTMRAFLVCKNELGEETLKPIGETNSDDDERKLSTPLPDYLPEDDNDIPTETSDKALAPHGITEVASNWINSAATFLQRSFYW